MGIVISVVIGLLFAGCGISYKIASWGRAYPIQNASVLSVFGAIVFAILGRNEWGLCDGWILLTGAIFGVTQYLGIRLLRLALKVGPLSPVWCAQSLNFIPVILYASMFLGESLSTLQHLALLATVGAIVAAAFGASGGKKSETVKEKAAYGFLLFATLVTFSVLDVGLKFCSAVALPGHAEPMLKESGNVLLCLTYVFMGGSSALDLTLSRSWRWNKFSITGALMLSVFAVLSYGITLCVIAKIPAAVLFVVSNAVSILGASLVSTSFMKEKRTVSWYFTVGFSLLAIILNR